MDQPNVMASQSDATNALSPSCSTMTTATNRFVVIGISDQAEPAFTPEILQLISEAKVFSGGLRHRGIMERYLPENYQWINVAIPLADVFAQYRLHRDVLIFASADPLFFGYAGTLLREFPDAEISVYPSFNSLQMLAHRLSMPYEDMRAVSLTGRPWMGLDIALIEREKKIGILTDRKHTPSAIAERLLAYGLDEYSMTVGELLGNRNKERIHNMSLEEAVRYEAQQPNVVLLRADKTKPRYFGIDEADFALLNGRAKMITKMPIRMATLATLGLPGRSCMWDIGFCTGSVSIEAKLLSPRTEVIGFEIREEGRQLMQENSCRFACPGIQTHIGDFFDVDLKEIQPPDAVFVGGHGGRLSDMIVRIAPYLQEGGVLVFNSVSAESRLAFENGCKRAALRLGSVRRICVDAHNPIEIMQAERLV